MYFLSHPHWTRREKGNKLGCANPVVTTVLYTLQATCKSQATCFRMGPGSICSRRVVRCFPVWMFSLLKKMRCCTNSLSLSPVRKKGSRYSHHRVLHVGSVVERRHEGVAVHDGDVRMRTRAHPGRHDVTEPVLVHVTQNLVSMRHLRKTLVSCCVLFENNS